MCFSKWTMSINLLSSQFLDSYVSQADLLSIEEKVIRAHKRSKNSRAGGYCC